MWFVIFKLMPIRITQIGTRGTMFNLISLFSLLMNCGLAHAHAQAHAHTHTIVETVESHLCGYSPVQRQGHQAQQTEHTVLHLSLP